MGPPVDDFVDAGNGTIKLWKCDLRLYKKNTKKHNFANKKNEELLKPNNGLRW